jgi:SAM-dependent methyltransferase
MWRNSDQGFTSAISTAHIGSRLSGDAMNVDYTYHYKKWHSDTPEHCARMAEYYKNLLRGVLPEDRTLRVLDIGCGMGYAMLALQQLGFSSVEGIDVDKGQVASCKAKGLNVSLCENSIACLKSRESSYHLILALDLIEHIPVSQQIDFVGALCLALHAGGTLICTVPNANSAIAGRYRYIDWTHQCSFTEQSLDFLLHTGGFRDAEILPVEFSSRPKYCWWPRSGVRHWWAFRFFRLWRRLELMAELGPAQGRPIPLSANIMAVAKKP